MTRIMVVEDEESFSEALSYMLTREGYEVEVSMPTVLLREEDGQTLEPMETALVDLPEEYIGVVSQLLAMRKGIMTKMSPPASGRVRLEFAVPSRGLIGFRSPFLTDTRGTGVMNRLFHGYGPYKGNVASRRQGVLIATDTGEANQYGLFHLIDRGPQFVQAGTKIYMGMIVGEHTRDNDLEVNPLKSKQLTNFRTVMKDDKQDLPPPRIMTLEQAIAYIQDDELVEVTPKSIRLRKVHLDPNDRKRAEKARESAA